MDSLTLEDPFRSKTLVYRSFENNDKDKKFFDSIRKDQSYGIYISGNVLRPVSREESDDAFKDYQKDVLAVFICLPTSTDEANKGAVIQEKPSSSTDKTETSEDDGLTPVGILSLSGGSSNQFDYDHHHRSLWLNINIARPYRNRGIGREAINWALDWSFQHAGMHSVGLGCYEYNDRGRHLYESLGFILGGSFRKERYFNRKWWDILLYSMLEDEWETLRAKA